jgi:hypothetical protein
MKTGNIEPTDARLRELLRASHRAPPLPPRFQEAVWRRIETSEAAGRNASALGWLDLLVERLLRPRIALAGLAALVLLSGVAGALNGVASARQTAQARYLAAVAPNTLR